MKKKNREKHVLVHFFFLLTFLEATGRAITINDNIRPFVNNNQLVR